MIDKVPAAFLARAMPDDWFRTGGGAWPFRLKPRRLWDHADPPVLLGFKEHRGEEHLDVLKRVGERTPVRGVLQLVNLRLAALEFADRVDGPVVEVRFTLTVPDRSTGFARDLTAGYSGPAPRSREGAIDLYRRGVAFVVQHEVAEGLWEGDPETDPHLGARMRTAVEESDLLVDLSVTAAGTPSRRS